MGLGISRKGDFKTADRRARTQLARHAELMKQFMAKGMGRTEASSHAMAVLEGKETLTTADYLPADEHTGVVEIKDGN